MAVAEIGLVDQPLAVMLLLAADRDRTGVDHPVTADQTGRLEAIVHAEHVELEGDPRRQIAADVIGEIDHPVGFGLGHTPDQVVKLADVAAHHPHLLAEPGVVGGLRVDVHADDFLTAGGEQRHEAAADKAGAADDHHGHACFSPGKRLAARSPGEVSRRPAQPQRNRRPSGWESVVGVLVSTLGGLAVFGSTGS